MAADDAKHLRNLVRQMALDALPEGERERGRIEVLPVQWRKHLNLGVRACCWLAALRPLCALLRLAEAHEILHVSLLELELRAMMDGKCLRCSTHILHHIPAQVDIGSIAFDLAARS